MAPVTVLIYTRKSKMVLTSISGVFRICQSALLEVWRFFSVT